MSIRFKNGWFFFSKSRKCEILSKIKEKEQVFQTAKYLWNSLIFLDFHENALSTKGKVNLGLPVSQ